MLYLSKRFLISYDAGPGCLQGDAGRLNRPPREYRGRCRPRSKRTLYSAGPGWATDFLNIIESKWRFCIETFLPEPKRFGRVYEVGDGKREAGRGAVLARNLGRCGTVIFLSLACIF